jgi:hypothetical protein
VNQFSFLEPISWAVQIIDLLASIASRIEDTELSRDYKSRTAIPLVQ